MDSSRLLFVYGSLLGRTGDAAVDAALEAGARSLGRGRINARLFSLGEYPGATPVTVTPEVPEPPRVLGRLLELGDPAALLPLLDAYEGFDARSPFQSEFVRSFAPVTLEETGRVQLAWVYFYNQPVRGRKPIASGDYLAFRYTKENPA